MTAPTDPVELAAWTEERRARRNMPARPLTVDPQRIAARYSVAFPKRPPLASTPDWVLGTWAIGAAWKNPNPLYGAYPRGYLERVHAMFPCAKHVLHVFSGGLNAFDAANPATEAAARAGCPAPFITRVDAKGPDEGRYPTWQGDVQALPREWSSMFDLILADPPYSPDDATHYGLPMPNRGKVMRELRRVATAGAVLVWLDTCWPMHRKDEWRTFGQIGVVRSTNHRVRLCSMFEAV